MKILILGGTREAAELALKLVDAGDHVTTSLAGRTKEPKPVAGMVRTGGFGGVEGLARYLTENRFDKLVDATHPFAEQISQNAKSAAQQTGIVFENRIRPPWKQQAGDNWIMTRSPVGARDNIPANARVLLALGSQHIEPFSSRDDVFFLVRMVDQPTKPLTLPNHHLLPGRPSTDWREEAAILKRHKIDHIVCRNSGGAGAYAKIEAARALKLPVIIIGRGRRKP